MARIRSDLLDNEVLLALSTRSTIPTYVIRNTLDWTGKVFHRQGLQTSHVLRSCRRLEKRGLVEEGWSFYEVMKAWCITPAGRAALAARDGGSHGDA